MELVKDTWCMHLHDENLRTLWLAKIGKSGKQFGEYAKANIYVHDGYLFAIPVETKRFKEAALLFGGAVLGFSMLGNIGLVASSNFLTSNSRNAPELSSIDLLGWKISDCNIFVWEEKNDDWNTYFSVSGKYQFGSDTGTSEITFMQSGCANNRNFMNKKNVNYEKTCNLLSIPASRSLPEMKQDMQGKRVPYKSIASKLFG